MDKLESMMLEAETVSYLMIQMADDDVGDTSFAVMSDLGENGTEHECDLSIHETALRASSVIDQLLAELEAKDERIAELEAKLATPVRLPDMRQSSSGDRYQWSNGAHNYRLDVISMLLGAGFTVAVEGDGE